MSYELKSKYQPAGDQPVAIAKLVEGIKNGKKEQVLLGATGTGKTFTIANVIEQANCPAIVLAHNKTLASQLYGELKELFPNNRVEYFVSYFDYYQPEAYLPGNDIYIEKDSAVNDEIERLRHSATAALMESDNVIVVSSVSCIYGLGSPIDYKNMVVSLRVGQVIEQKQLIMRLIDLQYERNDIELKRSAFRVKGDVVEFVNPYNEREACKIEFFGDEIEAISYIDIITNKRLLKVKHLEIFPATHYVVDPEKTKPIIKQIAADLEVEVAEFKKQNKLLEAQRLEQRTKYDLEMISEIGFCSGIENYTRYFSDKKKGETPYTLLDYFPENFLMIVDESHVTLPQVRGMSGGDRSRKENLVNYGFRLQAALDNRPLNFDEFQAKLDKIIYVSATPGDYELEQVNQEFVEQIIRPTGLLDPIVEVRPKQYQIDDIMQEIAATLPNKVLITTLTKKMAEDLTDYLKERKIKVAYLHSDIKTFDRVRIIQKLRQGVYDVLIGINLLREGLDIPEVSRVLILDADKEGFLRGERSLIQTIGRAARNSEGKVILYADKMTRGMEIAISETKRRREIQMKYNEEHGITPTTIMKDIAKFEYISEEDLDNKLSKKLKKAEKKAILSDLHREMAKFAEELNFEEAARIRDIILEIEAG
ncbi:MAG: excinuclease ABC subunit UvrB [Mycoplasmatales bacterium]